TGGGIPPDFLPRVFEPFSQGDMSAQRVHGGLGLGLAIVRHLVHQHGGSVEAHSAGEGHGASFTVQLPLSTGAADTVSDEYPVIDHRSSLNGVRVLIVEDDPDGRELLVAALALAGASVTDTGSVLEALHALVETPPDVVVCDIGLPRED